MDGVILDWLSESGDSAPVVAPTDEQKKEPTPPKEPKDKEPKEHKEHKEHRDSPPSDEKKKEHKDKPHKEPKEPREHKEKDRNIKIKVHSPRGSQPRSPRKNKDQSSSPEASPSKSESNEQTLTSPRRNLSPETEALLTLEQQFTSRTLEKVCFLLLCSCSASSLLGSGQ